MLTILRRKLRGLVAVEAVMAAFVFSLLGVSLMELFQASTLTVKHAQLHMLARQVAEVEGTTLSLIPFAELDAKGAHPRKALPNADGWESAVAMSPVQTRGNVNYRIAHLTLYRGSKATKPVDVIDWPLVEDTTGQNSAKARLIAAKTRLEALIAKVSAESEKQVADVQKRVEKYEPTVIAPPTYSPCPCTGDDGVADHTCIICKAAGRLCQYNWSELSSAAASGQAAAKKMTVGNVKCVHVNGKLDDGLTANVIVRATVLGVNHNASVEGNNRVHFILGKDVHGVDIAFVDSKYKEYMMTGSWFSHNNENTNLNGYVRGSQLRNKVLPLVKAALPSPLRNVIRPIIKWTASKGASTSPNDIESSREELFILSTYEVFGNTDNTNPYEAQHQEQYDYYKGSDNNFRKRYRHDENTTNIYWMLRSPTSYVTSHYTRVYPDGRNYGNSSANVVTGLALAFAI